MKGVKQGDSMWALICICKYILYKCTYYSNWIIHIDSLNPQWSYKVGVVLFLIYKWKNGSREVK